MPRLSVPSARAMWSIRLCALAAVVLISSNALRRQSKAARSSTTLDKCAAASDDKAVLSLFKRPQAHQFPWFDYVIWMDQAGLADGGGMVKVDPEALAYIAPTSPLPGISTVNRCVNQWTLYGDRIGRAGGAELTKQGEDFLRGFRNDDSRCKLKFDWNAQGTKAYIKNYFGTTWGAPHVDAARNVTAEVNPPFLRLFSALSGSSRASVFRARLRRAAEAEGEWGQLCCPGASDNSGPLDVVAACRPPVVQQCALFLRRNFPIREGNLGYQLYAMGYRSGNGWAPVPQAGGGTALATFAKSMKRIGVNNICIERD